MRIARHLVLIISLFVLSCNSQRVLFEKETWWYGHWQNLDDPNIFFSIGQKPIGPNEIITPQFFSSTYDSIYFNFYVEHLVDFDHIEKWKIIETNKNEFLKIKELENSQIEIYGPSKTKEKLEIKNTKYIMKPKNIIPSIPDSILYVH